VGARPATAPIIFQRERLRAATIAAALAAAKMAANKKSADPTQDRNQRQPGKREQLPQGRTAMLRAARRRMTAFAKSWRRE
jgi:hypothetical protein